MLAAFIRAGLQAVRSAQGRLAAGVALFVALTVFLWPKAIWTFEPGPFFAAIAAAIAWLYSILPETTASAHDRALLQKFRETIDSDQVTFLRRFDFGGGSFPRTNVGGVFRVCDEWEGADFTFDERRLNQDLALLIDKIVKFTGFCAHNTWPVQGAFEYSTAIPGLDGDGDLPDQARVRIAKLNEDATSLANDIDQFIRQARARLG